MASGGVLVVADLTATFETQMILAALKALYAEFRDPAAGARMVTISLLVSSVAAPVLGRLGDLFGRERMAVIAVGLAALGSVMSAVHPDAGGIIAGRALQGMSGGVLPLCYGIVREAIPATRHQMALTNLMTVFVALGSLQLTLLMLLQSTSPGIGLGLAASAAGLLKISGNIGSGFARRLPGCFARVLANAG